MTTIYVPRLIESAEQAEALPVGTVATDLGASIVSAAVRTGVGLGWFVSGDEMTDMHEHLVGWTALVPIDAGKEWAAEFESGEMYANLDEESARAADGGTAMARLVTPWEEA